MAEVQEDVERMQSAPLDYGSLARGFFEQHLERVDEAVARLRGMQSSFPGPKELHQSQTVDKADKHVLFPCMKLPVHERDAWFDGEACRFAVAQLLARRPPAPAEHLQTGFPVGMGRLVLCGAPSKKVVDSWAEGLNCVVTLLRDEELHSRGLDLTILDALHVEWLHLPISGAALEGPGDRDAVMTAASAVAERLRSGKTIAVHCSAGLHRTGIVGYLALRLLGWSRGGAFELLGQIRWETRAELEKIFWKSRSTTPDTPANLIVIAEELLLCPSLALLASSVRPAGPFPSVF